MSADSLREFEEKMMGACGFKPGTVTNVRRVGSALEVDILHNDGTTGCMVLGPDAQKAFREIADATHLTSHLPPR